MTPPPPPLEARDYIGLGASVGSSSSPTTTAAGGEAHLALRLGLPGSESPGRRVEAEDVDAVLTLGCPAPAPLPRAGGAKRGLDRSASRGADAEDVVGLRGEDRGDGDAAAGAPRAAKAQVVGWPPVRSYRKNTLAATANATKTKVEDEGRNETGCCYVKVKAVHPNHQEEIGLVMVLVPMPFRTKSMSLLMKTRMLTGCSLVICLGTWCIVTVLPLSCSLFTTICRKLKIMRGSEAAGMAPR